MGEDIPPASIELLTHRERLRSRTIDPDKFRHLQEACGDLRRDEFLLIHSQGAISAHHVLAYIIDQIGPCDLKFTSWAISLVPMQCIINYVNDALVKSLECILSDRVGTECPQAIQLLKANCDRIHLAKIHAKGFVAWNNEWHVSVNMTANFTINPRIESYCVSTSKQVFDFHLGWIEKVINEVNGRSN